MRELRSPRGITQVAYTHDGRALLTGDKAGWVHWWDLATGTRRELFQVTDQYRPEVTALTVSRDARLIAAVVWNVTALWDEQARAFISPSGSTFWVGAHLTLSPDGRFGLFHSSQGRLSLWDAAQRQVGHTLEPFQFWSGPATFAPDGKTLTVAGGSRIGVFDVSTGEKISEVQQEERIRVLAFSSNGDLLAAASDDSVQLWDTKSWQCRTTIRAKRKGLCRLAFHPGGTMLATTDGRRDVTLWDTRTGAEVGRYNWQIGKVSSVAFAPDGMTAAAGGSNRRIVIWDVEDVPT
jgi:WD40 repeat protein